MNCCLRRIAPLLLFPVLLLTGCSTHPLPEDFSRRATLEIVKKLRCEARAGIIRAGITDPLVLANINVGFDFKFTITEEDNAKAGKFTLTNPIAGGSFSLALSADAEKKRANERNLRVVDTLQKLKNEKCDKEQERENFVYPIAGWVGLDEVVVTYWKLGQVTTLRGEKIDAGSTLFSDKLTFTTVLGAGLTPTLEIKSGIGHFELTDATLDASVTRTDVHEVTMVIAPAVNVAVKPSGSTVRRSKKRDSFSDSTGDGGGSDSTGDGGPPMVLFSAPQPSGSAANVIDELNRIRDRDDSARALRDLKLLPN